MENFVNFYPTPKSLFREIEKDIKWRDIHRILEPSAGKGDICDFLEDIRRFDIECIEINPELQSALKGKGYTVIHDDFLSFRSKTSYDLIFMNPPFDKGSTHLLKALDIQKNGGRIICILNAETLKNPYTNERKVLLDTLQKHNASITYRAQEFVSAERSTNVEIAVVDVTIPNTCNKSIIFESLKERYYQENDISESTDILDKDYLKNAVIRYDFEVDAGLALIREYKAMCPHILQNFKDDKPIIKLRIGNKDEFSENKYVEEVRKKYWKALFEDGRFTKAMTSDMRINYSSLIGKLCHYDFSLSNIREIQIQICNELLTGIEDCIMKLFDKMSYEYTWSKEFGNNIHYYNGWATNKAWYVNDKVILPESAWDRIWNKMKVSNWELIELFVDMEKAMNYLTGCPGAEIYISDILQRADKNEQTKNINCKYFTLTFYKKGTVHITFTCSDAVKRLNIFAGRKRNMLPPSYGKKKYADMTEREQAVVREFDGSAEAYDRIYNNPSKYLFELEPSDMLPQLTESPAS